MINREKIWQETYRQRTVIPENGKTRISVFTAIHHHESIGKVSTLQLCAELQVRIGDENASHVTEVTLSPEDMEDLASYFAEAAKTARELKQRIDEDAAEIAESAQEALKKDKEAA